jgi:hypothetical protein
MAARRAITILSSCYPPSRLTPPAQRANPKEGKFVCNLSYENRGGAEGIQTLMLSAMRS